jgi:hypothetical protein
MDPYVGPDVGRPLKAVGQNPVEGRRIIVLLVNLVQYACGRAS